jgi:cyclopropane fatty-acyl-phospholipid synthase-like methyltransferase
MKPNKDAFGHEVLDFFNGDKVIECVEREDGLIDPYDKNPAAYFSEFKDWSLNEKKALKFAKGKVLDIGTGAGRIALYFQKKGVDVIAIDNSPLAIKVCKMRGVKNAVPLAIENVDRLKPARFDTVVMLGNNFGLMGGLKKAKMLLKKLSKVAQPNAILIAESLDPHKTNDEEHVSYHNFNLRRGRMAGQLKIRIRHKKFIGDWFDYLLVSKREMIEILKGTGWKIQKFIDSKGASFVAIIEKTK